MKKRFLLQIYMVFALLFFAFNAHAQVFLDSAIAIDVVNNTITLPLYQGKVGPEDVYYILTESSDEEAAELLGITWSPKLANALGTAAVQTAVAGGEMFEFSGTVDFSPERLVMPGPEGFPPAVAMPGSIGSLHYSPLATLGDGIVYNAPHVANSSGVHDSVAAIDRAAMTVTMKLVPGFYTGKKILYISTDVSDATIAALEESTFAPNMNAAPAMASGNPATSARSAIIPFVNGPTGQDNPERQGLQSALMGEGAPLNVTETHPRNQGSQVAYSPLWDVHPAVWTEEAIAAGERALIDHHEDIQEKVEEGLIVSGGAGPPNAALGGLRAAGFIVNCPIMYLE